MKGVKQLGGFNDFIAIIFSVRVVKFNSVAKFYIINIFADNSQITNKYKPFLAP
jgi:hypothetical protein